MMRRCASIILLVVLAWSTIGRVDLGRANASPSTIRVWISEIGPNEVWTVPFEGDYVKRVTEAELASGNPRQALFSVAVAVRSMGWNRVIHPLYWYRQVPADVSDWNPQRYNYQLQWGSDVSSVVDNSNGWFVAYKDDTGKGNPAFTTHFGWTGNPSLDSSQTNPNNVPNLTQAPYSNYIKSTANPADNEYPPQSNTGLSQSGTVDWANRPNGGTIWPQMENQFFTDIDIQTDSNRLPTGSWGTDYYNMDAGDNCIWTSFRTEEYINYDWGDGSAWPGVVGADRFCIRWTATVSLPYTGWYTFYATNDDGIWVQVDSSVVLDAWYLQNDKRSGMAYLNAGNHTVTVWYFEWTGGAKARVAWLPTEGLIGEYHSGSVDPFSSPITMVRSDGALRYDWWTGQPDSRVTQDLFSLRWRGQMFVPSSGTYTFEVTVDDGVQLNVDGQNILYAWFDQAATTYSVPRFLTPGLHSVDMWYYERYGDAVAKFRVYPP